MNVNMLYGICGKDNYNEALRKYLAHVYIEIKNFTTKGTIDGGYEYTIKQIETYARDLKTFILMAPPLSHDIKVFSMQDKDKPIEDFSKQFISTNIGEHCINWGSSEDTCYCITVPKGTPCLVICRAKERENELLLPWGTSFVKTGEYEYKDEGKPAHPRRDGESAYGDRTVFELKAIAEEGVNLKAEMMDMLVKEDWNALNEILRNEYPKLTPKDIDEFGNEKKTEKAEEIVRSELKSL